MAAHHNIYLLSNCEQTDVVYLTMLVHKGEAVGASDTDKRRGSSSIGTCQARLPRCRGLRVRETFHEWNLEANFHGTATRFF